MMSTIKEMALKLGGRTFKVKVEKYSTAYEVVQDLEKRAVRHKIYDMKEKEIDLEFHGVKSYGEALELLRTGYQPTVEKLQTALKANVLGNGKRVAFENNVHGFAPVVPLALKGVPNSMINATMKPIKCKVVDVYFDLGVTCCITSEQIIEAGQKLLGTIIELEKQGYRFNLYALQAFSDYRDADVLCVKVKSSDKPLDIKRISFPLTHPAFFRVIGFDWQSKSPITRDRGSGRGQALVRNIGSKEQAEFGKKVFGDNAIYLSCEMIVNEKEEYIKEALVG
jgi:hypothetical protein